MLKYLIKQSKPLLLSASIASIVHGICSVLLLAQISAALTTAESDNGKMALIFAATASCVMVSYVVAAILFERLGQRAHAELRGF
ncbi:MAG: cyclic peptide export ABC transporter, partial [Nitrosomonas ureae]